MYNHFKESISKLASVFLLFFTLLFSNMPLHLIRQLLYKIIKLVNFRLKHFSVHGHCCLAFICVDLCPKEAWNTTSYWVHSKLKAETRSNSKQQIFQLRNLFYANVMLSALWSIKWATACLESIASHSPLAYLVI